MSLTLREVKKATWNDLAQRYPDGNLVHEGQLRADVAQEMYEETFTKGYPDIFEDRVDDAVSDIKDDEGTLKIVIDKQTYYLFND